MPAKGRAKKCEWVSQREALSHFATTVKGSTVNTKHIKPLHWYISCRLVIEGGFDPDEIRPRPPFRVQKRGKDNVLHFEPALGEGAERTILGGLKTKNVDVVVTKEGLGPVMAISCKGVTKAYRNLTNRMEECVGECTNLHITYPAMAVGFFVIALGHRPGPLLGDGLKPNDMAYSAAGTPLDSLSRFHYALSQLSGRRGIRNDVSRYEAVALAMIEPKGDTVGTVLPDFPNDESLINMKLFFDTLYRRYEERFVFGAPKLKATTKRHGWAEDSPAFQDARFQKSDFEARYAIEEEEEEEELADDEDEG